MRTVSSKLDATAGMSLQQTQTHQTHNPSTPPRGDDMRENLKCEAKSCCKKNLLEQTTAATAKQSFT